MSYKLPVFNVFLTPTRYSKVQANDKGQEHAPILIRYRKEFALARQRKWCSNEKIGTEIFTDPDHQDRILKFDISPC
jgi:hypothetical protein